jgi:hypothetical protein
MDVYHIKKQCMSDLSKNSTKMIDASSLMEFEAIDQ